jgi:hypothetical protein
MQKARGAGGILLGHGQPWGEGKDPNWGPQGESPRRPPFFLLKTFGIEFQDGRPVPRYGVEYH